MLGNEQWVSENRVIVSWNDEMVLENGVIVLGSEEIWLGIGGWCGETM